MFGKIKGFIWISKRKFIFFGFLFLLFLLFLRKGPVRVETAKVTRGTLVETVSASGKVDALEKADLNFQGNGRIVWVGVKEGDSVKKYQALAKLDTEVLNSVYQQAINTYRAYEAAAQKAEDEVKGHSGDETFAQKSIRMAAQVARDNAYDAMKAAEKNLQFATIISPFEGIITRADPPFPGTNVTYLNAVYSVVNPKTFYFSAEIGETEIAKIKVGQKVTLFLDAFPDRELVSSIFDVGLANVVTDTGGTAYKVKMTLPEIEEIDYRLGMNGGAEITTRTLNDLLLVSADAVVEEDSGNYVWVVNGGKRVRKVKVVLGASSLTETEVKEGLKEGDLVILRPPTGLKNGSKISY